MRFRSLIPILAAVIGVLILVGAWVVLLQPARRDLDGAVDEARSTLGRMEDKIPDLAGETYVQGVGNARREGHLALRRVRRALVAQRDVLNQWFSHLGDVPAAGPLRDRFKAAYEFTSDRLHEDLNDRYRRATGEDVDDIPLRKPSFMQQGRDPRDAQEMREEQKRFNIEAAVLRGAADAGALPRKPTEVRLDFESGEGHYLKHHVQLFLAIGETKVPELLRKLRTLGSEGPIVGLESVIVRPLALPTSLGDEEKIPVDAEVHLVVYEARKEATS